MINDDKISIAFELSDLQRTVAALQTVLDIAEDYVLPDEQEDVYFIDILLRRLERLLARNS